MVAFLNVLIVVLLAALAVCLTLMCIGLWQEFGPKPSSVPRWQRRLWADWQAHPLPAPRPDCIIRTGRLY